MTCGTCAAVQDDDALYCRDCLALFLDVETDVALRGDEHLLALLDGCEDLLRGSCTAEDFEDFLQVFSEQIREREAGIRGLEIPIYLQADFAEEMDVGLDGVDLCNHALDILVQSTRPLDADAVRRALVLFYRGVCAVSEAMAINRRNRDRPLWA